MRKRSSAEAMYRLKLESQKRNLENLFLDYVDDFSESVVPIQFYEIIFGEELESFHKSKIKIKTEDGFSYETDISLKLKYNEKLLRLFLKIAYDYGCFKSQ
jgi:hypothetical protein